MVGRTLPDHNNFFNERNETKSVRNFHRLIFQYLSFAWSQERNKIARKVSNEVVPFLQEIQQLAQLPRSLNSEISQIPRSNELDTRYRVPGITVPAHSPEDPRLTSTANFGGGEEPRQREFESVFPGGRGTMPRNYSFACDRSSANDSAVCGRIDGCDITIC